MISATIQARIVKVHFFCRLMARAMVLSSRVEVLADDADQEEGDDIGQDDGHDTAGGCAADVIVEKGLVIDEDRRCWSMRSRVRHSS